MWVAEIYTYPFSASFSFINGGAQRLFSVPKVTVILAQADSFFGSKMCRNLVSFLSIWFHQATGAKSYTICVYLDLKWKVQRFLLYPLLPHRHSRPHYQLSTSPTRAGHLLQLMSLHWHAIILWFFFFLTETSFLVPISRLVRIRLDFTAVTNSSQISVV